MKVIYIFLLITLEKLYARHKGGGALNWNRPATEAGVLIAMHIFQDFHALYTGKKNI